MELPKKLTEMQQDLANVVVTRFIHTSDKLIKNMPEAEDKAHCALMFAESTISAIAASLVGTMTQNRNMKEVNEQTFNLLRGIADKMEKCDNKPSYSDRGIIERNL